MEFLPLGAVVLAFLILAMNRFRVGFGKKDITPCGPIWLSGYGTRSRESEGVLHPIFARAMAVEDPESGLAILLGADILGFSNELSKEIQDLASERFGIEGSRIILSASHNHSAPVNSGVAPLVYNLDAEQLKKVEAWTRTMVREILDAIGDALADLSEARLEFGQGLAGFGVNRRRARPGCRHLPAPVDHDVPVLKVLEPDGGLRGLVFGYACHTTTLAGYQINGDYAGFAQIEIEKALPGCHTIFVPGCAGDINPLPRGSVERTVLHGSLLAQAVLDVAAEEGLPISEPMRLLVSTICLRYSRIPSLEELEDMLAKTVDTDKWMLHFTTIVPPAQRLPHDIALKIAETLTRNEQKSIRYLIDKAKEGNGLPSHAFLPVCIWEFGSQLKWIHLGGEPVVDYGLSLKEKYGWNNTWVSGYYSDLTCYIPSLRVLLEGDYEGTDGMREYGHPSPFDETVEQRILSKIEDLMAGD